MNEKITYTFERYNEKANIYFVFLLYFIEMSSIYTHAYLNIQS